MTTSASTATIASPEVRLNESLAQVLRVTWVVLQIAVLAIAVTSTGELHRYYTETCHEPLCDAIAQPNEHSVALLAKWGIPLSTYAWFFVSLDWFWTLLWVGLGAIIVLKQPKDPVAMPLAFAGIVIGGNYFLLALGRLHPDLDFPGTLSTIIVAASFPLFLSVFPNGRFVPSWTKWVVLVAMATNVVAAFVSDSDNSPLAVIAGITLPIAIVTLVGTQIYRYRRVSNETERLQTKWLLFGFTLYVTNFLAAFVLFVAGVIERYQFALQPVCYLGSSGMVIAVGLAILRYKLFDIDVILNRAVVYVGLTLSIIVMYAAIVGGLGALLQNRADVGVPFLAAAVIAVAFQPLRNRLQSAANRLIYGERDDPHGAVSHLGRRLEASLSPETVLSTIVETVATALKLPYAAIALDGPRGEPTAEFGNRGGASLAVVPLVYQAETVGELRVAARLGERSLAGADMRVLDDLARHAGVAVHAVAITRDLQRAREQLVTAREEERRRLRRDLHDGLGPALASQALTIDTAGILLEKDQARAAELLKEAKAQSQRAVAEIRRVVYDLRPPALDDLGLVGALRETARSILGNTVTVEAPETLPPLPAATEVAAFRIAQEALTNVARHAGAQHCVLTLTTEDCLELRIVDDGAGVPENRKAGVGLISMRERAEELGGSCSIERGPEGGTVVTARLPLTLAEA